MCSACQPVVTPTPWPRHRLSLRGRCFSLSSSRSCRGGPGIHANLGRRLQATGAVGSWISLNRGSLRPQHGQDRRPHRMSSFVTLSLEPTPCSPSSTVPIATPRCSPAIPSASISSRRSSPTSRHCLQARALIRPVSQAFTKVPHCTAAEEDGLAAKPPPRRLSRHLADS